MKYENLRPDARYLRLSSKPDWPISDYMKPKLNIGEVS